MVDENQEEREHVKGADDRRTRCRSRGRGRACSPAIRSNTTPPIAPPKPTRPATEPTMRAREQIGRQNHDQRGPRLLAEEGDAEQHDREVDRDVRDEDDERHHRRARAERDLARRVQRAAAPQQPAREPAAASARPRRPPRRGSRRSSRPASCRSRGRRRGTSAARTGRSTRRRHSGTCREPAPRPGRTTAG